MLKRAKQVDRLLAAGFQPSTFRYGQAAYGFWREGMQLAKGRQVFTFTTAAEVAYIKGKQC